MEGVEIGDPIKYWRCQIGRDVISGATSENVNVKRSIDFLGLPLSLSLKFSIPIVMACADDMATLRSNNSARAVYRTKCRRKLSEHICKI